MQVLFLLLPWAVAEQTATYNIRPMQGNRFALEVFKSKLWEGRKHTFLFDRFSGSLAFDRERPERSSVRFVVESASARCVDDWVKPDQLKDIERSRGPGDYGRRGVPGNSLSVDYDYGGIAR
jgi:polyisoprenoid-binding protein YceI